MYVGQRVKFLLGKYLLIQCVCHIAVILFASMQWNQKDFFFEEYIISYSMKLFICCLKQTASSSTVTVSLTCCEDD